MDHLVGSVGLTPLTHLLSLQILEMNANSGNVGRTLSLLNLQKARYYPPSYIAYLTSLVIALRLHHWSAADSATQGKGGKGSNQYGQRSTMSHRWSSHCCPFLSPYPPPLNHSTLPPPPFPSASIVSIVTLYPHPPCWNQSRPSPNPTELPLLFYGRCSSKIRFFSLKILASPTGNTWEAPQCVILHQNDPRGASCPFKVMTLVRANFFDIMPLYVGTYCEK